MKMLLPRRSAMVRMMLPCCAAFYHGANTAEDACYGFALLMRIGPVEIGPGALLAPMEAVSDLPFRTICEEHGAALTFTEFLSAEALTRGAAKVVQRMWPSLAGRRFAVQVFGREPEVLARAASMAAEAGACLVDINMGCPARKVTAGLCGSALMREPALAASMVVAVRAALPASIPVTIKQRIGWSDSSINAPEFALRMVEAGAAMVTVHGRTRDQGFSGQVRLEPIAAVRAALPREIPVVGNGDVKTVDDYHRMKRETGCDAVMVGRAARGNPWLFQALHAIATGAPQPAPPTIAEQRGVWRRHADLVVEYASPKMCLHELRKTLAWYSRGLHGGADLRHRAFSEAHPEAVMDLGERFFFALEARAQVRAETAEAKFPEGPEARYMARHLRRRGEAGEKICPS
ncbi:MAG TPA: tRNA dihydrouridine synthase DusB [Polyangia bacterium]